LRGGKNIAKGFGRPRPHRLQGLAAAGLGLRRFVVSRYTAPAYALPSSFAELREPPVFGAGGGESVFCTR
jgi:hypothetical protein